MGNNSIIKNRFTFSKAEHLKSRKAIEQLFKTGKTFFIHPYKVFYQYIKDENDFPIVQAGFAASSRHFRRAVDRNRIKRLGREAYRFHKNLLWNEVQEKEKLQIFFVFTEKELMTFKEVQKKMLLCINRLSVILKNKTSET